MSFNNVIPAAIVRQVNTLKERKQRIWSMREKHIRTGLEGARDLGQELFDFRRQCQDERKYYTTELAETGISRRTASRYISIFLNWDKLEENWDMVSQMGLAEALNWLKIEEEDETRQREPGDETESEPGSPYYEPPQGGPSTHETTGVRGIAVPSVAHPDAFKRGVLYCRKCRKFGPLEGCMMCEVVRQNAGSTARKEGREVGFDTKDFRVHFGYVVRAADDYALVHPQFKNTTAYQAIRRLLSELNQQFEAMFKHKDNDSGQA
jgi:hypothetical protein